jgi:hypothetical protein
MLASEPPFPPSTRLLAHRGTRPARRSFTRRGCLAGRRGAGGADRRLPRRHAGGCFAARTLAAQAVAREGQAGPDQDVLGAAERHNPPCRALGVDPRRGSRSRDRRDTDGRRRYMGRPVGRRDLHLQHRFRLRLPDSGPHLARTTRRDIQLGFRHLAGSRRPRTAGPPPPSGRTGASRSRTAARPRRQPPRPRSARRGSPPDYRVRPGHPGVVLAAALEDPPLCREVDKGQPEPLGVPLGPLEVVEQ